MRHPPREIGGAAALPGGAFNTSGYPINIGAEDVRLYLDGQPYSVQNFDYLRHSARTTAQREMNLAWADAAVEYFLTLQEMEDHPRHHDIAYRSASKQLQASPDHIQRRLRQTTSTPGRIILETTTIDPARPTAAPSWLNRSLSLTAWSATW